jgi:hypothetical protein
MSEPENIVLTLLREMRAEIATKADIARLEAKIGAVRSEFGSEVKDLRSEVRGPRAGITLRNYGDTCNFRISHSESWRLPSDRQSAYA